MPLFALPTVRLLVFTATLAVLGAAVWREPLAMVWMGAVLAGVALTRAIAGMRFAQIRRQGFEMYVKGGARRFDVARRQPFSFVVVLRNRSSMSLHLRDFRVLASPTLTLTIAGKDTRLPAQASVELAMQGVAERVGHHAVHGVSLRVVHVSGAFEAPLIFVNPVQIVATAAALRRAAQDCRGGLSRRPSDAEHSGHMSGDSIELRELRAHQPGDALRKIAWKASARRGTLLVRDEELLERQTLWLIADASMELWAGTMGSSPLDDGLDRVAAVLKKYVTSGDRVGLGIVGGRVLAWVPPGVGAAHLARLRSALLRAAQPWDSDRSGCDEPEVARIVLEHLGRLDTSATARLTSTQPDAVARTARRILARFQFEVPEVFAPTPREKSLRSYAAAFGLSSTPRLEPERWHSDTQILAALESCVPDRPSRIIVASIEPSERLLDGIMGLRRRLAHHRIKMSWLRFDSMAGLPESNAPIQQIVNDSLRWQSAVANAKHGNRLKRLGIGIERVGQAQRRTRGTDVA